MRECQNCERLKQRISDLNSELLVLKIAAYESHQGMETLNAGSKSDVVRAEDKPRTSSRYKEAH